VSIDITTDSANFIDVIGMKQKRQLSELNSAILELNNCYNSNCYIERPVWSSWAELQSNL